MDSSSETREDVLHVPNLFDYFCQRTAMDVRERMGRNEEAPATSFAGLIITVLMAFAFYVFGRPQLAKATFVLFGVLLAWTIWGIVVRSSSQTGQKADNVMSGVFPPDSAPFVLARLKWWNHLIVPLRWGRHSRLFDRKGKLERKISELEKSLNEMLTTSGNPSKIQLPTEEEALNFATSIINFADRHDYESSLALLTAPEAIARGEMLLYKGLLVKLNEMADKLERIEKLTVIFHNVSPEDLSQVVAEAIQVLEERRILVLNVDTIEPEDFIDMVTVRAKN